MTDEAATLAAQRSRWSTVLIGVATVLAIVTTLTVWVRTQALDTDEWGKLSAELLGESEVQEALAEYLVDAVYTDLDVATGVAETLPPDLQGLAAPLVGALRGPLTDGVQQTLDSPTFQSLWEEANRIAHATLVAVLKGDDGDGVLSNSGGVVALELKPLVTAVAETMGLPDDLVAELPDDAAQVVIFESEELDRVQTAVRVLEFLAWFMFALLIGLYALAVYLSPDRRMDVVRSVGWSLTAVGIIVLMARTVATRFLVNAIVEDPSSRTTADVVASVATGLLRQMGWSALIYGLLIVGFTSLMGDHRWAVSARRTLAPALNASAGAVAGGTAILLLVLFWWSPGRAFNQWTTALTLIGLVIAAVVVLRTRTLEEFPDSASGGETLDIRPEDRPAAEALIAEEPVDV